VFRSTGCLQFRRIASRGIAILLHENRAGSESSIAALPLPDAPDEMLAIWRTPSHDIQGRLESGFHVKRAGIKNDRVVSWQQRRNSAILIAFVAFLYLAQDNR